MIYTIYDTTTGEIIKVQGVAHTDTPTLYDGQGALEGESNMTVQMVDLSSLVLIDRPPMPVVVDKLIGVADGIDLITITGIPVGTEASVSNRRVSLLYGTENDGIVEVGSAYPATLNVSLRLFPYVNWEQEVNFT